MINTIFKIAIPALACVTLTACGGSSTGVSSFDTIKTKGQQLIADYGTAEVTNVGSMPVSGLATYNGAAAYSREYSDIVDISEYATTVSDISLSANFATSKITGVADNFHTRVSQNISLDGNLSLDGTITGNTFSTNLNGTVTETLSGYTGDEAVLNGISLPVVYSGNTTGEFVGSNAGALRGVGTGIGATSYEGQALSITVNAIFGGVTE